MAWHVGLYIVEITALDVLTKLDILTKRHFGSARLGTRLELTSFVHDLNNKIIKKYSFYIYLKLKNSSNAKVIFS